jgi:hypothetical protein
MHRERERERERERTVRSHLHHDEEHEPGRKAGLQNTLLTSFLYSSPLSFDRIVMFRTAWSNAAPAEDLWTTNGRACCKIRCANIVVVDTFEIVLV